MNLNIELQPEEHTPLYAQIYDYIRKEIVEGRLLKGEKLPSTRTLSSFLHISRSTVTQAYSQLEAEGYIRSSRGSGAYVEGVDNLAIPERDKFLAEAKSANAVMPNAAAGASAQRDASLIDFSPRKIDMSAFPYPTWRRITRDVMAYDNADIFEMGDPQGDPELRGAIAHYLHFFRGCRCSAQQVVIGAGSDYLLVLLHLILRTPRTIAMESPTYLRAYRILASQGETIVPVPMDESGMRTDALEESGCDTAYVMPARQYPTGTVMPYKRRIELLQWANEKDGRYIIEDDYDSEFRYRGKPIRSLQSQDLGGKVIYMGTFSKSVAPAIRVSYMILPPSLLEAYRKEGTVLSSTVSRIDQSILNTFIRDGYFERYLNKMRTIYKGKHDACLEGLRPLHRRFEVLGAGAGLHFILRDMWTKCGSFDEAVDKEGELQSRALAAGVRIYTQSALCLPGAPYLQGGPPTPTILIGYASLSEEKIREGLAALTEKIMI